MLEPCHRLGYRYAEHGVVNVCIVIVENSDGNKQDYYRNLSAPPRLLLVFIISRNKPSPKPLPKRDGDLTRGHGSFAGSGTELVRPFLERGPS
jgi:hypothetical protein